MFALLLLVGLEAVLHSDAFLYKYRSVFAAGRAMDKLMYAETHRPCMLIAGNSRVDNGFDPAYLHDQAGIGKSCTAFNLGIPGANARIFHGLFLRLANQGALGPQGIGKVVIGLDESFLQADDSLGYSVFFADRAAMLKNGEYAAALGSMLRLWGYSSNFKQLREPAKLESFLRASVADVEPLGGGAAKFLGYRAGFSGQFQNEVQVRAQEAGSTAPPDGATVAYFWALLQMLEARKVKVAVVFPPLLNREVLFLTPDKPKAGPYLEISRQLAQRGIPQLALDPGGERSAGEFANAGHLNDKGARRFTRLLADELRKVWPKTVADAR